MFNNNLASCGLPNCMFFLKDRLCSTQLNNKKLEMVFRGMYAALSL